jgi:hypothetical protein
MMHMALISILNRFCRLRAYTFHDALVSWYIRTEPHRAIFVLAVGQCYVFFGRKHGIIYTYISPSSSFLMAYATAIKTCGTTGKEYIE